jgi:hypothetical protein
MEFDTEFIQLTSLGPSISSLTENLNLLRIGLWLSSVWTEVSHVRMVFCDCLFRNSAILSLSGTHPDDFAEHPDGLRYNSFLCSNRTLEYSEMLDSIWTCCHIVRTTCRDFPNSVDF